MAKHVLEGPLVNEQPPRAVVRQHGHASTLEVERHLVDLLPAADVDLGVAQDRLVERAAQLTFEAAVDRG